VKIRVLAFSSLILAGLGRVAPAAELHEQTLAAWEQYRALTEARIAKELSSSEGFLVRDFLPAAEAARIRSRIASGVATLKMRTLNEEGAEIKVPDGLIHHWYGSLLVAGAKLGDVVAWVQDYGRHQDYFEEVEESRLLNHSGQVFDIFLRLRRKKVITVHYNTDHEVTFQRLDSNRVASQSIATRIAEIENAGDRNERERPVGDDHGYLWRLNAYWRYEQVESGVVVECESISLSRDIPLAMRWLVKPFITSVPRDSLEAALLPLRTAFARAGR
jgi:hypothetical protein